MAAGITHEINQPLNAIRLATDGIQLWKAKYDKPLPEMFEDLIGDISQGVQRVSKIVEHMRSFWMRPEADKFQSVNLNDAISRALALLTSQMQNHFISLDLQLSEEPLFVRADSIQLEQIINNLTINAIHALDTVENEDKQIQIRTQRDGEFVLFQVTDNGPGFPNLEDSNALFDPFYSTKGPGKGMGLGLAIVKMFVDRFHGKIIPENLESGGARLTVRFPETQAAQEMEA